MPLTLKDICEEVAETDRQLIARSLSSSYRGYQVLYSPFIPEPDVLLIGINPGIGAVTKKNPRLAVCDTTTFAYTNGGVKKLSKGIRETFTLAGRKTAFDQRTMKTNYHYFATRNKRDLIRLIRKARKEGINLDALALHWTRSLIQIAQPKLIICEGKSVIKQLARTLPLSPVSYDGDDIGHAGYGSIPVLSYTRCRSYMLKKQKAPLAQLIASVI